MHSVFFCTPKRQIVLSCSHFACSLTLPPAAMTCWSSLSTLLPSCLCHFLFCFPDLQFHFTLKLSFMVKWKCMYFMKYFLISASASVYSFLSIFIAPSVRIHSEKQFMPVVLTRDNLINSLFKQVWEGKKERSTQ